MTLPPSLLLALALSLSLAACGRDDPKALVASAKQYLAKRQYSAAVIQLKNALEKAPDDAQARYLLGLSSLENGDLATAQIELDKARRLHYGNEELQIALARVLLAKGELANVVSDFGTAKLSSPALQAELTGLVGNAELGQRHVAEAEAAFREALALDPGCVAANLGEARLAASRNDLAGAMTHVNAALATAPGNGEALLLKADLLAAQGRNPAAEQAYRDAVAALPNQTAPRLALITHLLREKSLEKASAEVAALQKMAPKDPRSAYALALLRSEQGNYPAAREAILHVLKVAPDHVPSLVVAGRAEFEMQDYREAESHLRKAVEIAPGALVAKRLLAATHLRMGRTDLALAEAKELVAAHGKDAATLALAGEAYLASGDVALAERQYEKAKALAPDNAVVQTRLALVRLASGDADRGLKELESASAAHAADYQPDLALVTTYLRQRQPDKALQAVQRLEQKQPDNPLTYNLKGLVLTLKGDWPAARASFERAVGIDAAYMPAINNLVQLDLRDRQPEAAKKRYEAVLKAQPNNEQALTGLAVLLRITGAPQADIEKLLTRAVGANPSSPYARAALINFYVRAGDSPKALAAAQDAVAALPRNADMTEALGAVQLDAGETVQAIATFRRLTEMAPKAPKPLVELAGAQLAAKQPDDAIRSLRAALALRPDLALVERDIAAVYVASGRQDKALAEARAVQAKRPDDPLGYVLEGEIYLAQKKLEPAERVYRAALARFDLPILAVRTYAVMDAAGEAAQADAMARKWVSSHPRDTALLVYIAQRDLAQKRYGDAERHYKTALARQPENPLVLNNLAWVSSELGRSDAVQYAERANELAPQSPAIMDTLGSILAKNGQSERALELLGRAAELAPQAYQIRLNFAKALVKAGHKDAARKELTTLARLDSKLPVQREAAALLAGL